VDENPEHHSSPSDCLRGQWATVMPEAETLTLVEFVGELTGGSEKRLQMEVLKVESVDVTFDRTDFVLPLVCL
jgi:hypothetical protein